MKEQKGKGRRNIKKEQVTRKNKQEEIEKGKTS
jgi:hypothetical protein